MLRLGNLVSQVMLVTSPEAMGSWLVLLSTPGCLFRSIAAAILPASSSPVWRQPRALGLGGLFSSYLLA